ncbi:putative Protein kinase domain containing protein [Blattamonas nauphoetae]|uniref:Protein kinase domain-containing protein n=1 Tax=Blattamonas nauphoetae TaxID=2049346 RepID=A0ABQ9YJT6_9EUKA|nr:putative Protein kinase domain containing protein [Blattamonas nauphoetae]
MDIRIVALKEVATMGNLKVIVMELGRQSLADIVKDHTSRGVLVAREVVYRVMVDVSSALTLMHNSSSGATAHGDVKMENILLCSGEHFKLCDLGAAESETGSSSHSVMSQQYVSPERMESETGRATCSSDVWALGIVLHWLLFGVPLFKNKSILKLGREITSFQVSMIGESCGGEERALLMRMLDPNPETRITSSQLCSFGVFRCLVNTTSALWRLKDADTSDLEAKLKKTEQDLDITKRSRQQAVAVLRKEREEITQLKKDYGIEKDDHRRTLDNLKNEQITVRRLEEELLAEKRNNTRLERELAEARSNLTQPPLQPAPHSSGVRSNGPLASSPARQGTVGGSQIGAAAIEMFDRKEWTVSGNVFSKSQDSESSLLSYEVGTVIARLSFTIKCQSMSSFTIGIISSKVSSKALTTYFPELKGGAGWEFYPDVRSIIQNGKDTNQGSACERGREGQRVVLEADGREGIRTLKLSQDGETQPAFITNIPVPFRFAVFIYEKNDAVEIESIEVVSSPQMVGGTIPVRMD